ncbi:MAG: AmmeMemoRadiSam system protein A [Firmicutes bacterium]|nr:AmmeMemoRadiSam system protein A [Bacillota bacterium]
MVVLGALAPHPPIIVPAVGREELPRVRAPRAAMETLAEAVAAASPATVVVFTPHGNVFADRLMITATPRVEGSLARFGDPTVHRWETDLELAKKIKEEGERVGLRIELLTAHGTQAALDHGVLVPLSFFPASLRTVRLVVVGMGLLPLPYLYRFGECVAAAAARCDRRTVVLASGDLSHRLGGESPYGYDPAGPEFDRRLMELLGRADVMGILSLPRDLVEKAGECGYRSLVMMLGSLDGQAVEARVLSYEAPFGIGYGVALLRPTGPAPDRRFGEALRATQMEKVRRRRENESPYVRLARETVEAHATGRPLPPEPPDLPPEGATRRAGVFVSIKKAGELRGCIGTILPTRRNIIEEIRANAVAAAFNDPRFEPVEPEELPELVYSVDILGEPEPVTGLKELDPKRYGVIVSRGVRQGLLLPDLEGIDTPEDQVAIARRKAGIGPDEEVQLARFEVTRYY